MQPQQGEHPFFISQLYTYGLTERSLSNVISDNCEMLSIKKFCLGGLTGMSRYCIDPRFHNIPSSTLINHICYLLKKLSCAWDMTSNAQSHADIPHKLMFLEIWVILTLRIVSKDLPTTVKHISLYFFGLSLLPFLIKRTLPSPQSIGTSTGAREDTYIHIHLYSH